MIFILCRRIADVFIDSIHTRFFSLFIFLSSPTMYKLRKTLPITAEIISWAAWRVRDNTSDYTAACSTETVCWSLWWELAGFLRKLSGMLWMNVQTWYLAKLLHPMKVPFKIFSDIIILSFLAFLFISNCFKIQDPSQPFFNQNV